jgi:enamine deaminase RidA (YjgF/YER057c/UK114 family)
VALRTLLLLALIGLLPLTLSSGDKKNKEEVTQTLQLPQALPSAVAADTRRLAFQVTPLSAKGLLSQQTRDALKWLLHSANGTVVRLRAFVAGSGDLRRVRELVSETFTDHKAPLPVLTVVQVGELPLEAAQVVFESTSMARKEFDEHGLVFISAQQAVGSAPLDPVLPLAGQSLNNVATAVKAAGSEPADVLRVTCFLSSLDQLDGVRKLVESSYPAAALDFVQTQRAPARALAACEAVARLKWNTGTPVHLLNPDGLPHTAQFSQVALVAAPKLILTGSQEAFGFQDTDAHLAFDRLQKSLAHEGASLRDAVFESFYPLSGRISDQLVRVWCGFQDRARPSAATLLTFEGLPSMDASFAADVVAAKP